MFKANFGFMGLGVMGHMLALNMERNGFHVAGYDIVSRQESGRV
jgi:6-phosphogluconate dehydrogenase